MSLLTFFIEISKFSWDPLNSSYYFSSSAIPKEPKSDIHEVYCFSLHPITKFNTRNPETHIVFCWTPIGLWVKKFVFTSGSGKMICHPSPELGRPNLNLDLNFTILVYVVLGWGCGCGEIILVRDKIINKSKWRCASSTTQTKRKSSSWHVSSI